jgi:hypothetical protein
MDLALLGLMTHNRIVASGRVMRHRQIPVIRRSGHHEAHGATIDVRGWLYEYA